jgi:peptidyl-prolyl cis-trans isomerase C
VRVWGRSGRSERWAKTAAAGLVLGLACLAGGCAEEATPDPDVIARVGERPIPGIDFEQYLDETLGSEVAELSPSARSALLDQFLEETLLLQLAEERGLRVGPGPAGRRQVVQELLDEAAGEPLTDAELRRAFEAGRADGALDQPARVRLRQILVQDRRVAEDARAEIEAGADFGEVAQRLSASSSSAIGGDQGVLSRDELPGNLADDIFRLREGEVSPVIEAEYGFHLFQVLERLPAREADFESVRPELEAELRAQRADAALASLVADARARYDVVVYSRNLPFEYRGAYL